MNRSKTGFLPGSLVLTFLECFVGNSAAKILACEIRTELAERFNENKKKRFDGRMLMHEVFNRRGAVDTYSLHIVIVAYLWCDVCVAIASGCVCFVHP